MAYGMLQVPDDKSSPLMLFYSDLEKIRGAMDKGMRVFPSKFFTDGLLDDSEAILSVSDDGKSFVVSPIKAGLFAGGLFAVSLAEIKVVPPSEQGEYFVYLRIKETTESVNLKNDIYTPVHNYDKELIEVILSKGSAGGIRIGKLLLGSNGLLSIIDNKRTQSYIKDDFVRSIFTDLNPDHFFVNGEGKISVKIQNDDAVDMSVLNEHKTMEELDHPDGSVTTDKIKDEAVTKEKISVGKGTHDITAEDIYASRKGVLSDLFTDDIDLNTIKEHLAFIYQLLGIVAKKTSSWLLAGSISAISTSPDAVGWQKRSTSTSVELYDAVYGNGNWFIVGENGTILRSLNYSDWVAVESGVKENLNAVIYIYRRDDWSSYFVFGNKGTVLNGMGGDSSWYRIKDVGTSEDIYGVVYEPKLRKCVAVGSGGGVFKWNPHIPVNSWTLSKKSVPSLKGAKPILYSIAYGGDKLVIVGENGTILTSSDYGDTFTKQSSGTTEHLYEVAYGNGSFVVAGARGVILSSEDGGISWQSRVSGVSSYLYAAHFADGTFIVAGDARYVLKSPDGHIWTRKQLTGAETKIDRKTGTNFYTVIHSEHLGDGDITLRVVDRYTSRTIYSSPMRTEYSPVIINQTKTVGQWMQKLLDFHQRNRKAYFVEN